MPYGFQPNFGIPRHAWLGTLGLFSSLLGCLPASKKLKSSQAKWSCDMIDWESEEIKSI